MDSVLIPAVCGFAGAVLGSVVSVAGVCFAQAQETKRKMFTDVVNAAVKFWEAEYGDLKARNKPGDVMLPMEGFILCMLQFLPAFRDAGKDVPDFVLVEEVKKRIEAVRLIKHAYFKMFRDRFPEPNEAPGAADAAGRDAPHGKPGA